MECLIWFADNLDTDKSLKKSHLILMEIFYHIFSCFKVDWYMSKKTQQEID